MMKAIKRILALFSLTVLFLAPASLVAVPVAAFPLQYLADTPQQEICSGVGLATTDGTCGDNGAQVNSVISAIINLLSIIIGVVAVIMIIVAGLRFITSGGDAQKVGGAKNAIIYALIGLAVVVFAQGIVRFVLANLK